MVIFSRLLFSGIVVVLVGCVGVTHHADSSAANSIKIYQKQAENDTQSTTSRVVAYLNAARFSARRMSAGDPVAVESYNNAVTGLTMLLRSAEGGRWWNQETTFADGGSVYQLRFAKATRDGVWDVDYFTSFRAAQDVPNGDIKNRNVRAGVGAALVGIHQSAQPEPHIAACGVNAAVTAVVEFHGSEARLILLDPTHNERVKLAGISQPLHADFSAPLAAYPQGSELWHGLMGVLRVEDRMKNMGLFMTRPYDPDRIPVIFVHGLISTPRMWRRVINELEMDPAFRRRYQCWLFGYPTGNPPAYSALRLRQELASVHQHYPRSHGYVLVGHSMGGLVSRMQVTTVQRQDWDLIGETKAHTFFASVKPGDLVDQSTCFRANPDVARVIFICTPHRGSKMALGRVGSMGMRLISLPVQLTSALTKSVGDSIAMITGDSRRMPTSVTGLSPKNPTFVVMDHKRIEVPYHSIIGDEGIGDTPNSSDGIVEYWSSHLNGAQSECIVPGPHGACELPETLTELRRIFRLHEKQHPLQR